MMLRARRQYHIVRGLRRMRALTPVSDRNDRITSDAILCFVTLRNERVRLPYFLDYYRRLGIDHFLIVDNASDDGSRAFLAAQPDVSLWTTAASYREARFGMDWINALLRRHGTGHWCLTVDADEFLVYPHDSSRPLRALTDWLYSNGKRSFPAMLLDMYPKGPITAQTYAEGDDPFAAACWFDPANYAIRKNPVYRNLWIQGGPRARMFFTDDPERAPSLNKIPLVRWQRHYAYVSSTHALLPRSLNIVYDEDGGEMISGVLLHAKFLSVFVEKAAEEMDRQQHYAGSREYRAYLRRLETDPDLWCAESRAYQDWRQLEDLGLISRGNWA